MNYLAEKKIPGLHMHRVTQGAVFRQTPFEPHVVGVQGEMAVSHLCPEKQLLVQLQAQPPFGVFRQTPLLKQGVL